MRYGQKCPGGLFFLCRRRRRAQAGSGGLSVGTDCNAGLCRVYRMSALSAGHVLTHKRVVGVSTLTNQDQHPHHQKRENRETPTHKQASTPRSTHSKKTVGSALLSHDLPAAVPSAQKGLTSRFGKDTGCNPLAKTTNTTKTSNTPNRDETHQSVKQIST